MMEIAAAPLAAFGAHYYIVGKSCGPKLRISKIKREQIIGGLRVLSSHLAGVAASELITKGVGIQNYQSKVAFRASSVALCSLTSKLMFSGDKSIPALIWKPILDGCVSAVIYSAYHYQETIDFLREKYPKIYDYLTGVYEQSGIPDVLNRLAATTDMIKSGINLITQ